jgi:phosphohistidine phosphatase
MKNITVIRHAKSSWELNVDDFYRPISKSGKDSAIKVAKISRGYHQNNSKILVSAVTRTSETAHIFASDWHVELNNQNFSCHLYTFDLLKFEQIVKSCQNSYNNLILFGHNNAITDFVNKFGDIFVDTIPTSRFVIITFEVVCWSKIKKGKTQKIIFPRDI